MKTAIFSIGVFLISLFLGSCQPSETSCSVVDTGKTLDYKIGDKLLFSYNYTTVYPAPGVDSVYKRSGFIHPLKTLGGEVMTNCSPADHYHHFGLWYAWTKTTFEGNEIDFWNLHKKQGTVRFRNFEHVSVHIWIRIILTVLQNMALKYWKAMECQSVPLLSAIIHWKIIKRVLLENPLKMQKSDLKTVKSW